MKQIITVGRGHSGTRCMAHTLKESGVYCGKTNAAGDLIPPEAMYKAVRQFGGMVKAFPSSGIYDFSKPMSMTPPENYQELVIDYLKGFEGHGIFAWKLPEAVLALPWLVQMFPDAYYIHWVRDGRDSILRWHGTDNDWYDVDVGYLPEDRLLRAGMSWHYHEELIAQTPKPERWLRVRLEDFLTDHPYELSRLSEFIGIPLVEIYVNPRVIGRYKTHDLNGVMPILQRHLLAHGYME